MQQPTTCIQVRVPVILSMRHFSPDKCWDFGHRKPECRESLITCLLLDANSLMYRRVLSFTLIERKSRLPQLQGVQGRSRSRLLRALGNAEDGTVSAFPKGKQNGEIFLNIISHLWKIYEISEKIQNRQLI